MSKSLMVISVYSLQRLKGGGAEFVSPECSCISKDPDLC